MNRQQRGELKNLRKRPAKDEGGSYWWLGQPEPEGWEEQQKAIGEAYAKLVEDCCQAVLDLQEGKL